MKKLILLSLLVLLTACNGVPIQIPNVPEGPYDVAAGRPISARGSGFQLLLWFPIGVNQRHEECWRRLRREVPPGYFITDITIKDSWTYWLVGTQYTVEMEAMAYPYVTE